MSLTALSATSSYAKHKFETESPPGIASPDKVATRLGTLQFSDGFPDKASADTLLENLDFQRAVQAYLLALPPVSQAANRDAIRTLGPVNRTVPIFEQLMDLRSTFLTANANTVYSWAWLDLTTGPLVVEIPPKVLGAVNDMWYRWVVDVGITGPQGRRRRLFVPATGLYRRHSPWRVCTGSEVAHLQSVDSVAELLGERRSEARRGSGQGANQILHTGNCPR